MSSSLNVDSFTLNLCKTVEVVGTSLRRNVTTIDLRLLGNNALRGQHLKHAIDFQLSFDFFHLNTTLKIIFRSFVVFIGFILLLAEYGFVRTFKEKTWSYFTRRTDSRIVRCLVGLVLLFNLVHQIVITNNGKKKYLNNCHLTNDVGERPLPFGMFINSIGANHRKSLVDEPFVGAQR
ncbi:hypothetical protein F5877DRAFT_72451 [Lentinula edodes]|nr:hypothetical protein F5877DRAFT_72451 [Lentinula edodes]